MGRFQVERYGEVVAHGAFGGRKARRLLAILAARRGQVVTRDILIEALWPDRRPSRPGANLNAIVGRLRKALAVPGLVETRSNGYLLCDDDRCVIDFEQFERDVTYGLKLLRDDHPREAALVLGRALARWREPLPEETYSEWASEPIRRLESLHMDALEAAARAASAAGDQLAALRYAREAYRRDELRESTAVTLARVQAKAGDAAAALGTLDRHRRLLVSELGVEPSLAASATREAILRDELPDRLPQQTGPVHPTTELVGRDPELRDLLDRLERGRLVSLTGPGGIGKTRLAVEIAGRRRESGAPVVFCTLDHLDDPELVPRAVAHATEALVAPERTVEGSIAAALQDQETLLVLDGCEGVIAAVVNLVATLLARCPALTVLVTSRERCGLPGEHVVRLDPLEHDLAVELFLQRLLEADPSARIDEQARAAVEQICSRLDGVPLALELTAAQLSSMSIGDLLQRLQPLPPGGSEPLLATVESSYRLLHEHERHVLDRLSVFPSDFGLAAAEDIAAPSYPATVVTRLVDKSLVARVGADRYRLLAITRTHAERRLEERGEVESAQVRHTRHYLQLAEAAAHGLTTSDEPRWMRLLDAEIDNLRAVQRRAVARSRPEDALQLAACMTHWAQWRLAPEPFMWAAEAAALDGASEHPLYPATLGAVALGATNRGRFQEARRIARRALAGEDRPVAARLTAMRALCLAALYQREAEECHRTGAELERMAQQAEQPFFSVDSMLMRASVDVLIHRPDATTRVRHALLQAERLGVPSLIALGNELLGESLHSSRPDEALSAFRKAGEIAEDVSCELVRGLALLGASSTLLRLDRLDEAAEGLRRSILHWRRAGNIALQWATVHKAARLLDRLGHADSVQRILAAADADEEVSRLRAARTERLAPLPEKIGTPSDRPPTLPEVEAEALAALEAIAPGNS